ncbi:cysteine hydrolase [Dactylosporangium fulvum]|uniref:Cysteine hydrolase n=1 Tax=Dactylosporangium fulvum TaxID=53359 RepID=A0ABY5VRY7_9ACTN|nr:isochorismatase family cysteine hydrolase [Dactylosporangium fulvum]UWP79851.1 cysteine hydrolase [Dactylosporangium fulvum]
MSRRLDSEVIRPGDTAVLTMELQRGIVGTESLVPQLGEQLRVSGGVDSVRRLLVAARSAGVAVVHATVAQRAGGRRAAGNAPILERAEAMTDHLLTGSVSAQLLPELGPEPDDITVERLHGVTPFTGTELDATLRGLGVRTIVLVGVSLNMGILGASMEAVGLGYRVVVPVDGVAGVPADYAADVIRHSLRYLATLSTVDDIVAAWPVPTERTEQAWA